MEIYISKAYFSKLDDIWHSPSVSIHDRKNANMVAISNLLCALPIYTDVSVEEIQAIYLKNSGNKNFNSFLSAVIMQAIKSNHLYEYSFEKELIDFNNLSAYYFIHMQNLNSSEKDNGIICKGSEFNGEKFYEHCAVTDLPIKNLERIRDSIPPTNSMLIVDKYVFEQENKLFHLIEFIKLYKGELKIPFHLTILFSKTDDSKRIQKSFNELKEIGNIEIQLYYGDKVPHRDRVIFTNYCSINIGHPFEENMTWFNQKFIGLGNSSNSVKEQYNDYYSDLRFYKKYIDCIPTKMGMQMRIWETTKFSNRIFDFMKKL